MKFHMIRREFWAVLFLMLVGLTGCADRWDPSSIEDPSVGTNTTTTTNTATTVSNSAGSMTLELSNSFVAGGASVDVIVSIKDTTGKGIEGALVVVTTDATYGVITPTSGRSLTDANGNATLTIESSGIAGAATVKAESEIGGKTISVSRNYASGASTISTPANTTTVSNSVGSISMGLSNSFVAGGASVNVSVSLKDPSGKGIEGALVLVTTEVAYGVITPSSGRALTDVNGNASLFLASAGVAGAATLKAEAEINGKTISVSRNYATGAATVSNPTTTTTANMSLSLDKTFVAFGSSLRATVTLTDEKGTPVPNAVVTFRTDGAYGVLTPSLGTSLTDSSGQASVTLNAATPTASGASTLTAEAQIGDKRFSVARGYAVGTAGVVLTQPAFGTNPLSTFGNTGVTVTATSGGAPLANQVVTFTSMCAASGKANLATTASTGTNGQATASYQDLGCGTVDTVTASLSGLASASATITVIPPSVGSIQFVSANPTNIVLKGAGGSGRQETSVVKFRVVDAANNPLAGRDVDFSLSTQVGGIALSNTLAKTDSSGEVSVLVLSGTVATSVRVSANVAGTTLVTQSDQLSVSVGLPDQDSFDLSVSTANIEGWNYSGESTTLTVNLADVFNNPVPDGTTVNFIAEGGRIQDALTGQTGRCLTVNSRCSANLISSNPRPTNGRVTVTAYAIGEESFTDKNGNGKADTGEFTNYGEVYRDDNENGVKDTDELFVNFSENGYQNESGDPLYNGSMCEANAAHCSSRKTTHVWRDLVVVFSSSTAKSIDISPLSGTDLGGVGGEGQVFSFNITIKDANDNEMPAGSNVVVTATNGTVVSGGTYVIQNTNRGVTLPQFTVGLKNDVIRETDNTGAIVKRDPTPSGSLIVTVTTPKGSVSSQSISITN